MVAELAALRERQRAVDDSHRAMNDDSHVATLHDFYGQRDQPWQDRSEPIIRFWDSESGECFGFPFFCLSVVRFLPHEQPYSQRLILYFPVATVFVAGGPKLMDFYDAFCEQRATLLKADGKEILSVKIALNGMSDVEAGSSGTSESPNSEQK